MNNWSDEARNELERFLIAERGWLAQDPDSDDVDHEEVIADLRAHVREELRMRGHLHVEPKHLHKVLQLLRPGFGTPDEVEPFVASPTSAPRPTHRGPIKVKPESRWFFSASWAFGVILPALALFLELGSHPLKDGISLDPIPGPINVFLIALVPIMNMVMLLRDCRELGRISMGFAGAALTTTILYSVLFLPLLPLGAVFIVFGGIGFLILSPQLSMIVTWRLVKRCHAEGAPRGALVGGILTVLLICGNAVTRCWSPTRAPTRSLSSASPYPPAEPCAPV